MKIEIPILSQQLKDGQVISEEKTATFDIDTSVYSEERWEQNFPQLAARESLFQYIERIQSAEAIERVKIISMLKAVYCFIESDKVPTYKSFAQMFNLAAPEYVDRLIEQLKAAFDAILAGSSVKN